jgi:hypothetical protein
MTQNVPPYLMSHCNEPIPVYQGAAVLALEAEELTGEAVATVRWQPRPRTVIELQLQRLPANLGVFQLSGARGRLTLPDIGMSLDVFLRSPTIGTVIILRLEPASDTTTDPEAAGAEVIQFQILNLMEFYAGAGAGPVDALQSEHWRCELHPEGNARALLKQLEQEGGYALTHRCTLTRRDGGVINRNASGEVLHAMAHFFAFIQGAWAPPLFARGLAAAAVCWCEWHHRYHQRWQSHFPSWFNEAEGESMQQLFPGFMARWESELWRDALRTTVYWYVQCNREGFGIDGALVLAQAALERMAWTYVVEDRCLLSAKAFSKLPADDQLRLFLASAGVPVALTEYSPALGRRAKEHNWADGVQAIVEVRNALVHGNPTGRKKHFSDGGRDVLFEAWQLALYLLELAVLRICGYEGMHASRLDLPQMLGKVVRVPWANASAHP